MFAVGHYVDFFAHFNNIELFHEAKSALLAIPMTIKWIAGISDFTWIFARPHPLFESFHKNPWRSKGYMSFMAIQTHVFVVLILYWMTPTEINACSCDKLFLFYFNSYSIESTKWGNIPFLNRHSLPLKPIKSNIWLYKYLPYTLICHANQVLHKNFAIWKYFTGLLICLIWGRYSAPFPMQNSIFFFPI